MTARHLPRNAWRRGRTPLALAGSPVTTAVLAAVLAATFATVLAAVPAAAQDEAADQEVVPPTGATLPAAALPEADAASIIAAAPDLDAFPDADVVVLHQGESIAVDGDGRVTRRVHLIRRLQTQWAMRSRSDVRVAWDRSRQELEVLTARTFMRDGTVVPTPANGTNEVTPDAVSRAAPFLDWRELVISHVGTEPGCVTELIYEVRDLAPPPLPPSGV